VEGVLSNGHSYSDWFETPLRIVLARAPFMSVDRLSGIIPASFIKV